jgi:hypothetical protein
MNFSLSVSSVVGLFICFIFLAAEAAEYCLLPSNEGGKDADNIVCCSTPAGWEGWKDDPKHLAGTQELLKDPLTRALFEASIWFFPSDCVAEDRFRKKTPECSSLTLEARGRDSRGQPDVETGLRNFLHESEQLQDRSPRKPPCVVVERFGAFDTENSGVLMIWQIRCPSGSQHLVTLLAQRDVLVTIDLGAPDIKDIVPKVGSLKELARSVSIIDASLALPDIVEININQVSDAAIKQQLLQLAPVGTPMEKVYEVLQSRLYREAHRSNGDLWTQIGTYSGHVAGRKAPPKEFRPPTAGEIRRHISDPPALPPTTIVKAVWKFDNERKLCDIEIRREVVEFKPKQ